MPSRRTRDPEVNRATAALCCDATVIGLDCGHGDETELITNHMLDLRGGETVRHLEVTAWDE